MKIIGTVSEYTLLVELSRDELAKLMGESNWHYVKSVPQDIRKLVGSSINISDLWELMAKIKTIRSAKSQFGKSLKAMMKTLDEVATPIFIEDKKVEQ